MKKGRAVVRPFFMAVFNSLCFLYARKTLLDAVFIPALLSFFRKETPMADAGYLILMFALIAASGITVQLFHYL
jgi:hypothetical protein